MIQGKPVEVVIENYDTMDLKPYFDNLYNPQWIFPNPPVSGGLFALRNDTWNEYSKLHVLTSRANKAQEAIKSLEGDIQTMQSQVDAISAAGLVEIRQMANACLPHLDRLERMIADSNGKGIRFTDLHDARVTALYTNIRQRRAMTQRHYNTINTKQKFIFAMMKLQNRVYHMIDAVQALKYSSLLREGARELNDVNFLRMTIRRDLELKDATSELNIVIKGHTGDDFDSYLDKFLEEPTEDQEFAPRSMGSGAGGDKMEAAKERMLAAERAESAAFTMEFMSVLRSMREESRNAPAPPPQVEGTTTQQQQQQQTPTQLPVAPSTTILPTVPDTNVLLQQQQQQQQRERQQRERTAQIVQSGV